ncbi:MAG: O-antigen ligase family protein [Sphingomicrobium sp.]
MRERIASILLALYLLACIGFGGSAQSPWTNLGLQIAGILLIAYAAVAPAPGNQGKNALAVNILLACTLFVILIQLIPLPAGVWTRLPGRSSIAEALGLLGYPLRPFPIAEMPYEAVLTLFAAIPAIAAFVATERLAPSPRYLAAAILLGLVAAIFLGALQVAGGPGSSAYLYEVHSARAIGFFANGNHMATLLLVGIPMAAALVASAKPKGRTPNVARYGLGLAMFGLIVIGIILNGSRAAMGLSIPVIVASAALFPGATRWRGPALGLSCLALIAGVAIIVTKPIAAAELTPSETASVGSRGEVWTRTVEAIGENFPVGTGLGSFQTVYHRYEQPDAVTGSYVNHAHNEYLEIALELGAAGIVLMILFLAWWVVASTRIWISTYSSPFARAATIATAAILAHSFVDFPLRTGAISAIFAVCIGLMTQHLRPSGVADSGELRPTRHVKLG